MTDDRFKTGGGFEALNIAATGPDSLVGRDLGEYRVVELIAEGGMGRVYRARRIDGSFKRDVALKVCPVGGFDERMRDRFQMERSLLASLNHPNIAQLFDARATEEGWPYFVMELVDGGPIDEHCERQSLDLNARLRLFIEVVDAVALAHSRLVIHRDLKPSNVLVNSEGHPKLVDFGIAKTLEGGDHAQTRTTPLTPKYASPEQLLGQPVTVASDIFQLGHLLHQVLLGRAVAEETSLSDVIERAATHKPVTIPDESKRQLPRELVAIIEQCLRVTADERYRDANALRNDLQNYLDGYPVCAAGQSAGYRFQKFIGRHKPATAVTAIAAILVIGGSSWYTWQLANARDEALQAQSESEAVLDFLIEMLAAASPNVEGKDVKVVDALDVAAAAWESELVDRPYVQARIHGVIGDTFKALGQHDESEQQHLARLAIYDALGETTHKSRLEALYDLVWLNRERGDFDLALQYGQEALALTRKTHGENSPEVARATRSLADTIIETGRYDDAQPLLETAVSIHKATLGVKNRTTSSSMAALARLHTMKGDYVSAVNLFEEVYAIDVEMLGEEHLDTLVTMGNMLEAKNKAGLKHEAVAGRRKQLDIMRRVVGDDHPYTLITMTNLAMAITAEDEHLAEREQLIRDAMKGHAEQSGPQHPRVLFAAHNLGKVYRQHGRFELAETVHRQNLPMLREVVGTDHPRTLYSVGELAASLCRQGKESEATPLFEEFTAKAPEAIGVNHPYVRLYFSEQEACLAVRRRADER